MSECLVVRLDVAPRDTAAWIAVDETGALLGPPGHGHLSEAVPAAAGRQVIALVPALDVLRIRAEVPVRTGGKLLQALPFALEEQLAEDVDDLHFAAGSRDPQGKVPVAVTRREVMDGWTRRLAEAGLAPTRAYCESDAVGAMPNTATLLIQPDCALLSDPDGDVTAFDSEEIDAFLGLWMSRRRATPASGPLHLVVYGSPEAVVPLTPLFDDLRSRVESLDVRTMPEGALPRMAAQIVTSPGINLLQGDYAQRSGFAAYWPPWRSSAALLSALAVAVVGVYLLELRQIRGEIAALDRSIDQAFHYVFPDAGPVGDARTELSGRLQQLGGQSAGSSREFLDVLRVVAQAVAGNGQTRIEGVNYRSGTMELRLRAPDVESLDRIQQAVIQAGGLKAQIQSANASGSEVIGRLQITRAGG